MVTVAAYRLQTSRPPSCHTSYTTSCHCLALACAKLVGLDFVSAMTCRHEQAPHEPGHVPLCCGACEPHLPCAQSAWGQHAAGGFGRQWPPEPGSFGSLHLWHGSLPGVLHWSSLEPPPFFPFFLSHVTCLLMHHALRQQRPFPTVVFSAHTACRYDSVESVGLHCSLFPFTTVTS